MSPAESECTRWGIWSYRLNLTKALSVLGNDSSNRSGWIIGRKNPITEQWQFGEVAPIPTFHNVSINDVYEDIVSALSTNQPAQTALVQNVLTIWDLQPLAGVIRTNNLLGSSYDHPLQASIIKIKLGRKSLDEEIDWFTRLQKQFPTVRWRLDCNKQWSLTELLFFWSNCNQDTIDYFEDPLYDPTLMSDCPQIPFALDESLSDHPELLQNPNVIAMVIKPTLHLHWKRIFFDHPSKKTIFSSTFEGSLGIWGLGQLVLHHSPNEFHGLDTLGWFAEECVNPRLESNPLQITNTPPEPNWDLLRFESGQ